MERREYIIESDEDYQEMLKTVKDGDMVTFKSVSGSDAPDVFANLTFVWLDAFDRPNKINEDGRQEGAAVLSRDSD